MHGATIKIKINEHRVLVEKLLRRPEMRWKSEMDIRERAYEDGDEWGELNPILWEVLTSYLIINTFKNIVIQTLCINQVIALFTVCGQ